MNALTITNAGQQRIANALLNGLPIQAVQMAVGTSAASLLNADSTTIGAEVLRVTIDTKTVLGSQVVFEGLIPEASGPWTLSAVGIYDDTGILIAYGALPNIYKPAITDGFGVSVRIKALLAFSAGAAPVTVIAAPTNDPSIYYTPNGTRVRLAVNDDLSITPIAI